MGFLWAWALTALVAIPLAIALYVWLQRRKRRFAVRYPSLSLVRDSLPRRSRWRRHLPFALLLTSAALLVLALARPRVTVTVPVGSTTIVLALDASRSMCATDVDPNRLSVATDAARSFIEEQPEGTRFGVVAFSETARVVVPATTDRERLTNAIDRLTTSLGTAIGSAVLKSIDALAEVNSDVAPSTVDLSDERAQEGPRGRDPYIPDIIVLLTDGANTRGIDPLIAAQQAADRRARVYTIGFGTTEDVPLVCTRDQLGGFESDESFGTGPPGGVPGQYLYIDEPTLRSIAETTGGEYYRASNADRLVEVFDELPARVEQQEQEREISVGFVGVGALLALAAVGLSLWWNRYP
jgi:Ca-activated chloride channel homolog